MSFPTPGTSGVTSGNQTLAATNLFRRATMPYGTTLSSVVCEDDPTTCCQSGSAPITATTIPGYTLRVEKTTLRIPTDSFEWLGEEYCETVAIGNCCTQGDPVEVACCDEPIARTLRFFVAAGACTGLTLNEFADLEYDDGEGKWIGTYSGVTADSFIARIWCSGVTWTGDIACATAPTERTTLVIDPDSVTCNPTYLRFDATIDWATCSSYFGCQPIINVYGQGADPDQPYALRVTKRRARIRATMTEEYCAVGYANCCEDDPSSDAITVDCCPVGQSLRLPRRMYLTVTNIVGGYPSGISVGDTFPVDYQGATGFGGAHMWNVHSPDPLPSPTTWPAVDFDINLHLCTNPTGACGSGATFGWSSTLFAAGAYIQGPAGYLGLDGCAEIECDQDLILIPVSFRDSGYGFDGIISE